MYYLTKKMLKNNISSSLCLAFSILLAPANSLAAEEQSSFQPKASLQLTTSIEEVNGVREIETGDYLAGTRKTLASLNKLSAATLRAPYLINLCAAYIVQKSFDEATKACDESVQANKGSATALNNRAILHYLQGNIMASRADLARASQARRQHQVISANQQIIGSNDLVAKN